MTYVCYRNGEVEFIGSKYQVLERYGWAGGMNTLRWYTYPSARKRGKDCFVIEKVND